MSYGLSYGAYGNGLYGRGSVSRAARRASPARPVVGRRDWRISDAVTQELYRQTSTTAEDRDLILQHCRAALDKIDGYSGSLGVFLQDVPVTQSYVRASEFLPLTGPFAEASERSPSEGSVFWALDAVEWQAAAGYATRRRVLYEGEVYRARRRVLAAAGWNATTEYADGDRAVYQGTVYRAQLAISGASAWDMATAYTTGTRVVYEDTVYRALRDSTGAQPDMETDDWEAYTPATAGAEWMAYTTPDAETEDWQETGETPPSWDAATDYVTGDAVAHDGQAWTASQPSLPVVRYRDDADSEWQTLVWGTDCWLVDETPHYGIQLSDDALGRMQGGSSARYRRGWPYPALLDGEWIGDRRPLLEVSYVAGMAEEVGDLPDDLRIAIYTIARRGFDFRDDFAPAMMGGMAGSNYLPRGAASTLAKYTKTVLPPVF